MEAGTPRVELALSTKILQQAVQAKEILAPKRKIRSLSTDSRNVLSHTLFFALPGERVDGHDFLPNILTKNAAAAVIATDRLSQLPIQNFQSAGCGVYAVENPLTALQSLASWHRRQQNVCVLGLTGSVGKTTTKELLASALIAASDDTLVLKTQGNLNSQIGLPLMVLQIKDHHRFAVLEMGLSLFGELSRLSHIARPDIASIIAIAAAHLEFLGSLEGVAKAKSEIFDGLSQDGVAVLPKWDPRMANIAKTLSGRVFWVGDSNKADARFTPILEEQSFQLEIDGKKLLCQVPLLGLHHAKNAALALSCAVLAGADPEKAAYGISQAKVPGGRSRYISSIPGISLLDDTYNANPASMLAALESLALLPGKRSVAVLGEMLELGSTSKEDHISIGRQAAKLGIDVLFSFGKQASAYALGAREEKGIEVYELGEDFAKAAKTLCTLLCSGDRILLKGSRGAKMERFLHEIRTHFCKAPED